MILVVIFFLQIGYQINNVAHYFTTMPTRTVLTSKLKMKSIVSVAVYLKIISTAADAVKVKKKCKFERLDIQQIFTL